MRLVILGANGQLGHAVVRHAVARAHEVTAFVRHAPTSPFAPSVQIQIGDALREHEVRAALTGQEVVVNAIGAGTLRSNEIESRSTAIAVAAAQDMGISRYIAMSAGMVAMDRWFFRAVLAPTMFRNLLREHRYVEELVRRSSLTWTIVRPSRLRNGPAQGYTTSLDHPGSWSVTRDDVAAFIIDEIAAQTFLRQAVFVGTRSRRSSIVS